MAASGCGNVCGDDGFAWQQAGNEACLNQATAGSATETGTDTDTTTTGVSATEPTTSVSASDPTEGSGGVTTGGGLWCKDADGDGFGDPTMCEPNEFPGAVPNDDDCADDNADAFPGAAEAESRDACMEDADGDGWGDAMPPPGVEPGTDCADDNAGAFPGAAEKESDTACMEDADEDGYGDDMPPPGVEPGTDCNDDNATIFPDAASLDLPGQCAQDSDGDGYGDSTPDDPEVPPGTDCADDDPFTFPGAAPNDSADLCMTDADGDDWGDDTPSSPDAVPGSDCDDSSATTFPGSAPNNSLEGCYKDDDDDDWGDENPPPGVQPGTDCNDSAAEVWTDCADCTPNEVACVDKDLQICNETGTGAEVMTCDYGCDDVGLACWPELTVEAGGSACIDMGASLQLQATAMGGDGTYSYAWTPAMSLDDPMIADPTASPAGVTTYTVDVTDGEGNMASDSVTVYVKNQTLELDPDLCETHDYPFEIGDPTTQWQWNDNTKELCQTVNGRSAVLFCGWDLDNATIAGNFSVKTAVDDDFTGFIWGVQDLEHFYIFTWKQAGQEWGPECGGFLPGGMQVKVIDVQDPDNNPLTCADLHAAEDTANSKLLVSVNDFTTQGWLDFTDYRFELTHKADGEMTIVVRTLLNLLVVAEHTFNDTTFAKGKFGMYTKSQQSACFSNFTASCI